MKKIALFFCFLFLINLMLAANEPEVRVAKYRNNAKCAISYTFDDGLREHFTLVAPRLHQLGMQGTFWIVGSKVNEANAPDADTTRVSWTDLDVMHQYGMEISNHTWSHKKLINLSLDEAKREIQRNDTIIYQKLGVFPRTFCYPYNAKNEDILKMASADRVATRLKQVGVGGAKSNSTPESLRLMVDKAIANEDWAVAMIHGITYGYDAFEAPDIFWNHLEEVRAMNDSVWVGTFRDVAAYCEARDRVKLEVQKQGENKYMVTPSLALDEELFAGDLTLVVECSDASRIGIKQGNDGEMQVVDSSKEDGVSSITYSFNPFGAPIYITITDR